MATATTTAPSAVCWPPKYDVLGVQVSGTHYDEALESIVAGAKRRERAVCSFTAVHAVVSASCDRRLLEKMNRFSLVAPDGQPVRWALNRLYGLRLKDRVYGPEMTLRVCRRAAEEKLPIYLYGGTPEVLERLRANLLAKFPDLVIAGAEAPPFRPLTEQEDRDMVLRVNQSGAAILLIGLGCPKQDHFAADHVDRIDAVQLCVGAAFDFHAGVKRTAPAWMQKRGLEWLFRVSQEPRRLWRRYLVTNTIFVTKFLRQWARNGFGPHRSLAPSALAVEQQQ